MSSGHSGSVQLKRIQLRHIFPKQSLQLKEPKLQTFQQNSSLFFVQRHHGMYCIPYQLDQRRVADQQNSRKLFWHFLKEKSDPQYQKLQNYHLVASILADSKIYLLYKHKKSGKLAPNLSLQHCQDVFQKFMNIFQVQNSENFKAACFFFKSILLNVFCETSFC